MVGGGKGRARRFLVAALDLEHQIAAEFLMQDGRALIKRPRDVGDRGQRVVIHVDGLGCVLRLIARFGDDACDHIAHMAHTVFGKQGAQRLVHGPTVGKRHRVDADQFAQPRRFPIGGGEHLEHAFHGGGARGRDIADGGVGMRAADEGRESHARQGHIVDIIAGPGQKTLVLAAAQGLAEIHS